MVAHCWRRKTLCTPSRRTHRTSPLPIAHSHAGRTDAPVPSPAHCGGPTTAPAAAFAFVSPWPSNILRNPIAFYGDSPRQQLTSRFKGHISPNYFHHGLLAGAPVLDKFVEQNARQPRLIVPHDSAFLQKISQH